MVHDLGRRFSIGLFEGDKTVIRMPIVSSLSQQQIGFYHIPDRPLGPNPRAAFTSLAMLPGRVVQNPFPPTATPTLP